MAFRALIVALVAALLPLVGVLQALPHHHGDEGVSREELACTASNPSSQEEHLHAAGHQLGHQPCLACLTASSHADVADPSPSTVAEAAAPLYSGGPVGVRARLHTQLPLLRGPPIAD